LEPYRFSFTAANAMPSEFVKLAIAIIDGKSIEEVDPTLIGREKKVTHIREFRELKHRIKNLTSPQIELLAEGTHDQQLHITHLALCKTYHIYRDFVTEVLAEKIQLFDYSITDLDYNSFISKKKVDHPELDELAHSTQKKVKQVIYRMLDQVELIDSSKNPTLHTPTLDEKTEQAIIQDDPKLLRCFLYVHNTN